MANNTILTPLQLTALTIYAREHGRTWKADLRDAWMTGHYNVCDASRELQQVRNNLGPSWLVRFRLDK